MDCVKFIQLDNKKYKNIYLGSDKYRYRKCISCESIKLENEENYRFRQDQNNFIAHCRACERQQHVEFSRSRQIKITAHLKDKYSIGLLFCYDTEKRNCFVGPYNTYFRKCSKCNLILIEKDNFYLLNKNRGGIIKQEYHNYCNACNRQERAKYAANNPDKIKAYNISEIGKQKKKEYENRAKKNESWLDRRRAINRKSINKHKEKRRLKRQTSEFRQKRRDAKKKRYANNPSLKLRDNISNAILKALKKGKSNKAGQSILQYLGYTILELRLHIEQQFDSNMNWDNYGKYWHLDHIIPQSDLPFSCMSEDNFKKCWNLDNLRPLEAKQNISDGATRIRHYKMMQA